MGVPYYFYNIYKKYNNKFSLNVSQSQLAKSGISHLFLDYNSMIHPCAQNAMLQFDSDKTTEEEIETFIISKCLEYTLHTLQLIKPMHVFICIDGVAPCGKLIQQKERRYKSQYLKQQHCLWDTNKITPGTLFMSKLTNALQYFIKNNSYITGNSINVTLSSSNECGEGEHKMMNIIREIEIKGENKNIYGIYGLDADLIMLSLLSIASERIVLIRDQKEKEEFIYLSAAALKHAIFCDLNAICISTYKKQLHDVIIGDNDIEQYLIEGGHLHDNRRVIDKIIMDHVFLCFLVGNDFLQGLPSISIKDNGIGIISRAYVGAVVKHKTFLTRVPQNSSDINSSCNWSIFKEIIVALSNAESYYFKNIYKNKACKDALPIEYSIHSNQHVTIYIDDVIKYGESGFKLRHYNYYGVHPSEVNEMCEEYITGLLWVWGYYNGHIHHNWTWYYSYHTAPFATDLHRFLEKRVEKDCHGQTLFKKDTAIRPMEQLLMVLPKSSLQRVLQELDSNVLEKVNRLLRTRDSRIMDMMFPNCIALDLINKEYLWQSKVLSGCNFKETLKFISHCIL